MSWTKGTARMTNKLFVLALILIACGQKESVQTAETPLTEFSGYCADPTSEFLYSQNVQDTFRLFKTTPKGYNSDSARKYPLILIMDGNAFFEPTVAELKFNSFIGLVPKAIVVGLGYKDFPTMDSLRSRDYTYPVAIPEYEMTLSGGAEKFKKFIDQELIPKLVREYAIDLDRSVICGHSLGGYFTLFYGLKSMEENAFVIKNIVSASPSLHYNNRYLFEMAKHISQPSQAVPLSIYISMGSEDMSDDESISIFDGFANQLVQRNFTGMRVKKAAYSNFGHIDAAVPGFIKGMTYLFEE